MSAFRYGGLDLERLVLGLTTIWTRTSLFDGFDYENGPLDPERWVHLESDPGTYKLGVVDGAMRLDIPDNTFAIGIATQRSRYRFATPHEADNGYVEVRVANIGKSDHRTHVFRRSSVDGKYGVGMELRSGSMHICNRTPASDALMVNCGAVSSGDIWRLHQVGDLHTMFRNGRVVGEWDDTANAGRRGPDYRWLTVRAVASKDILGPRRFSASLDYVECS